jgi:calnexin
MLAFVASLASAATPLPLKPKVAPFHFESFATEDWEKNWHVSKLDNVTGRWFLGDTPVPRNYRHEKMIFAQTENAYYGLSTKFSTPLVLKNKSLIVQYETRFLKGIDCGGAYIKLFGNPDFDPLTVCNESRYVIMFGPDHCGTTDKVHFIFNHKNLLNGSVEEKHLTTPPPVKTDKINHLYTLIVRPDQSFEIWIDAALEKRGSLLEDFTPSVNPPRQIDDPTDHKPADWVEDEMIDDPEAEKPEDWDESQPEYIPDPEQLDPPSDWFVDEPRFVPDPDAHRPDDWDDDIHGEWEPPTISNPKCEKAAGCGEYEPPLVENPRYQGKWRPSQIPNPAFKGEWKARQIPNPDYYEDPDPFSGFPDITGAGFELWMVNKDIGFGNVYIGQDEAAVKEWNEIHFKAKVGKQQWEQKKIDDAEKAKTAADEAKASGGKVSGPAHRDGGPLADFFMNLRDAYVQFYDESPQTVALVSIAFIAVPVALISFGTCFKKQPRPLTKEEKAARRKQRAMKRALKEEAERKKEEEVTHRAPTEGKKED